MCWKSSWGPQPLLVLELQRHTKKQLEVFITSSLVNAAAVIVDLEARHEMLLGWKPGGSTVWKANSPDSRHHHLLMKYQQSTLHRALCNLLKRSFRLNIL